MLKPSDAVTRMADLMGISSRANLYATRLLREAGDGLWPEIGIGRGRQARDVRIEHLLFNLVAVACSVGQPSFGPQKVREFQRLRPRDTKTRSAVPGPNLLLNLVQSPTVFHEIFRQGDKTGLADPQLSLSALLCELVKIAIPISDVEWGNHLNLWPIIRLIQGSHGRAMRAEVTWPLKDQPHGTVTVFYTVDDLLLPGLDSDLNQLYCIEIVIGGSEIAALATIARDIEDVDASVTRPAQALIPDPTPGRVGAGNAVPETTKAAGPGSHDGLLTEQPAPTHARAQTPPVNKVASNARQGGKQSAPKPGASGSQVRHQPVTKDTSAWPATD